MKIRKNLFIPQQQIEKISALTVQTGLNFSEIVRRSIDAYLKNQLLKK